MSKVIRITEKTEQLMNDYKEIIINKGIKQGMTASGLNALEWYFNPDNTIKDALTKAIDIEKKN